jgi:signal transduction histidine kinase
LDTFAVQRETPLKIELGFRGGRIKEDDPDPSVTLDLGNEFQLDRVYLIPAQREYNGDYGIFPKQFTLEVSNRPDFSQRTVVFTTGSRIHQSPGSVPVPYVASESARYVRLTVHSGHDRGVFDLFGLSEIVVISGNEPVSFGAKVSSVGSLDISKIWCAEALVDGKTPLGIWHAGPSPIEATSPGDAVFQLAGKTSQSPVTWTVDLGRAHNVDRVELFPYQLNNSIEATILPERLSVVLSGAGGTTTKEWTNPLPGSASTAPLVVLCDDFPANRIQITSLEPWSMGPKRVHALSEISVWSEGRNAVANLSFTRQEGVNEKVVDVLTDGLSSDSVVLTVDSWLQQLHQRAMVEQELAKLRPLQREMSSQSELNATWGSAVALGFTFLIPVFLVERRRLMSRKQLDQIRRRIASDLHDDIGSNLGSISLIARTARKDVNREGAAPQLEEDLGEMETIARESSLAMRDIVWLLERKQDSIGDLTQRMRETANRLLRDVTFHFDTESKKTTARLTLDAKRHLFLFYKEAIHNILKHAKATEVHVRVWDEEDRLALEVRDNGVGLPRDPQNRPVLTRKLRDRAEVLGAALEVVSAPGQGTRITLLVKRNNLTNNPNLQS